ncbi:MULTISPECIES: pilus assembly PilX family protein [Variovorax]|uniref:Type IV pilus assembly protein PilX n=1 Tax=Variovorax guangxiensis TaxID=1775474 RepID=A0A840FM70_9BURK|nr:PilX N-terminal domain-containing pilus assembly protein [Variovorax guangxiensis]MBB4221235.1 type IV pilus assembly protein PilX [Variovorax guangxiensis]
MARSTVGTRRLARKLPAQHGFTLFIVMIMLLLSALLLIGGARTAVLLESMAGNQREYQRAFEAAEAALLDAERDIRQLAFDSASKTYVACSALATAPCRKAEDGRVFPDRDTGWVTAYMNDGPNSCDRGICYFSEAGSVAAAHGSEAYRFWRADAYKAKSARYGEFTGAPKASRPALAGARYWIEVIDRRNSKYPLYRITATATGLRSVGKDGATKVELQVSFDPDPVSGVN